MPGASDTSPSVGSPDHRWPEYLRDRNDFWARLREGKLSDRLPWNHGFTAFWARWFFATRAAYLEVWGAGWWIGSQLLMAVLVVSKFLFLNPPWIPFGRRFHQFDFQFPFPWCRSHGGKRCEDPENPARFMEWVVGFVLSRGFGSPLPEDFPKVRAHRFMGRFDEQVWYEQVNLPVGPVQIPLPPLGGYVLYDPDRLCMIVEFKWWSPHWGRGFVCITPHPDPDISPSLWFRGSFEMWPFLAPLYDRMLTAALGIYVRHMLEATRHYRAGPAADLPWELEVVPVSPGDEARTTLEGRLFHRLPDGAQGPMPASRHLARWR